ncbi:PAS domain-containing protein [Mariniflexile gromovii]|uniref:histidine kinase n=1 Tax=Mariniflexile gromovii TaxID=362523 RepID=A0ABS4BZU8_9FLAO|nr:PAS domain-containing protein [Mariniflexile gromovii]MBP0905682.1 PAS domain-containing protein [Mariniflexile gromovii]
MKNHPIYLFLKRPLIAGVVTFIILLIISQYIAYQKFIINENTQKKEINNQVNLIKEKLQGLVMYSYTATKTLAYNVERNGIPEDFDDVAKELLERNKYFDVVELVDGEGYITHVYPLKGNDVIGLNILKSDSASSGALATIKRKDFFIAGPVNLKQGGVGIISRQPIFIDGKFSGFSAVVTKLSTFFNDLNIGIDIDDRFKYQLSKVDFETGREEYFLENDVSTFKEYAVPIEMSAGEWKLYVIPAQQKFNTAIWFALFGFLISVLGSLGVWYFLGQSERLDKLINKKLLEQEAELKSIHEFTSKQIKKSESRLNKAQEIAKIGSWELDFKTKKLLWSKGMFRIFGKDFKKFEVSQEMFYNAIHPDDRNMVISAYNESVKNNTPYRINYRLVFNNGQVKYVDDQCETFYDEKQNPVKSIGIMQDVTDRKKIEEVLENSELLYRSLTSHAPVGIFHTDTQGACTYVNEEWMKYSGMNFDDAMGYGWLKALHPEDRERIENEWKAAVLKGGEFKTEMRFQDKKGKITFIEAKSIGLFDTNNNLYGYIGTATDITERINNQNELLNYKNNLEKLVDLRTEELNDGKEALLNLLEDLNLQSIELEKEKVKAQSADLMKSAFLATMSHELRTPMNSIIGFTGILLKEFAGPLNEEQKKQLSMVKASSEHLLRLINDVLDISKIEAGKLKVFHYPFNYLTTLEKTIDFLDPQASKKGLVLKTEISRMDITLNSDERRIEQVLLNLLSNAIKFSNKGTIKVKVDVEDDMLVTQVIDQGIGISKKNINKLFMPFIQLNGGLSRSHEGTGLGLAICKNLIEKLGGTIEVHSKVGEGSNFIFKLPIAEEFVD